MFRGKKIGEFSVPRIKMTQCRILGCNAVYLGDSPMFRGIMSPPSSEIRKTLKMGVICSPKRRNFSELQGVRTQNALLFIVTAVKTSNSKWMLHCCGFLLASFAPP
jgi:hypothetical protein